MYPVGETQQLLPAAACEKTEVRQETESKTESNQTQSAPARTSDAIPSRPSANPFSILMEADSYSSSASEQEEEANASPPEKVNNEENPALPASTEPQEHGQNPADATPADKEKTCTLM